MLTDYLKKHTIKDENGEDILSVPSHEVRSYKRLVVNRDRANRALTLVPPSYIVSLVSVFDSFYAGLIRCIYNLEPKLLYDSEKTFKFRDIEDYGSISEIKRV